MRSIDVNPDKRLLAIVVAIVASVLVVVPPAVSSPVLAQTPTTDIKASKNAPGQVLAGQPITYTLSAENASSTPYYNLTFRDVLPLGVTYAGPSSPAAAGEPQVTINQVPDTNPGAAVGATIPQQTLIWSNVADLQARDEFSLTFTVNVNSSGDPARNDVHVIGATIANRGEVYAGSDPRRLPSFDSAGVVVPAADVVSASTPVTSTTLTAVEIAKSSTGGPEGEMLRGVHDQVVTYSLTVRATSLGGTSPITVTDLIPAQLEFLGCGREDNGTSGPGGLPEPEYAGAPLLSDTPQVAGCVAPDRVDTVSNPVLGGVSYIGVYTLVQWDLSGVDATNPVVLSYAAGIPLFANALFPVGSVPATNGPQGSNLDNNTGASTREPAKAQGEQAITNIARIEGDFDNVGLLEPGTLNPIADEDTLARTIEDLRIRKEIVFPQPQSFASGSEVEYQITVESSEYMNASDVVLTDTVPNGLCPLGNVTSSPPPTESVCAQNRNPTLSFESVDLIDATGGYLVVFDPIDDVVANGTFVARYRAFMRGSYEGGPLDGRRTVSGDSFTNVVESLGTTTGIDEIQAPAFPTAVGEPVADVADGSSTTLTTGALTLDKELLPRDVSPRLSASVPAVDRCPDNSTNPAIQPDQYIDADATPVPGDIEKLGFRLGDQICFRLRIDFDTDVQTRNAVVTDFVPLGTEYVDGTVPRRQRTQRCSRAVRRRPGPSSSPSVARRTIRLSTTGCTSTRTVRSSRSSSPSR